MTSNTQIWTKRISFILALLVIAYVAVDTYLFTCHKINTITVTTPIIIGLVVTILLCGLLQRFFYTWLTKDPINFFFDRQSLIIANSDFGVNTDCADEIQTIEQPHNSVIDNYDTIRENIKKKKAGKQVEVMNAIREYVTTKTAPCLSREAIAILISNIEYMACDRSNLYEPICFNIDNPLRSPGLRHLAWNVDERLGVSLAKRAVFIKLSFPHKLEDATLEYLKLSLRDQVPSQIPIDVPDKGDYHFHLETDNGNSD